MTIPNTQFSRRRMMGWGLAVGLVAAIPASALAAHRKTVATAPATPYVPHESGFSHVAVDTSGLAARGLPNYAARIAEETDPLVAKIFADRMAGPGAPRLIVKVNTIELGSADSVDSGMFGSGQQDTISGAGLVVDAHGNVLFEKPLWTGIPTVHSPADVLYVENLRAVNLVGTLARWIKQDV